MEMYICKSSGRYMLKMQPPKRPVEGGATVRPGKKEKPELYWG